MHRKAALLSVLTFLLVAPAAAGAQVRSFSNPAPVVISDLAPATPYPDAISVSGMSGQVDNVTATFHGFAHVSSYDVDAVLVAPGGKNVILMGSRCNVIPGADFTFDDMGNGRIPPLGNTCGSGTYMPASSDIRPAVLPAPGPAGPYGAKMSALDGSLPNGQWKLFVDDASIGGDGVIAGGWTLSISTRPLPKKKKCRKHKHRKHGKCVKKHRGSRK